MARKHGPSGKERKIASSVVAARPRSKICCSESTFSSINHLLVATFSSINHHYVLTDGVSFASIASHTKKTTPNRNATL
jgi:hypothetical protein